MGSLVKIIVLLFVPLVVCQLTENNQQTQQQLEDSPEQHEILDIEAPETFSFSASPLQQPESLQSKPYFDFLSELYAHDEGKKSLFANPPRNRRYIIDLPERPESRPTRRYSTAGETAKLLHLFGQPFGGALFNYIETLENKYDAKLI